MLRWLSAIEPILVLLGGILALWVGIKGVWVASKEQQATRFTVNQLVQDHDGQQWLKIKGRVPEGMVVTRLSKTNANAPRPTYKIWVPVVPQDWQPPDPVHVVICHVCATAQEAKSWRSRLDHQRAMIFSGMLRPFGGPRDYGNMFPQLNFDEPMFFLNEGNEPASSISMYLFVVLGFVLVCVGGVRTYRTMRL